MTKDRVLFLSLLVVAIATLFLPFRTEVTGGYSFGLFGGSTYHPTTHSVKSGIEIPFVYIEILLIMICGSLMVFGDKLWLKITSLVFLLFTLGFCAILYFALTFHLNLFGPRKIVKVGIGYYALLTTVFGFSIFIIITFVRSISKSRTGKVSRPNPQTEDLLDN